VVIPVPQQRPKSRRKQQPERAPTQALQDHDPTNNTENHGTLCASLPLIDFSCSVPVDPTPTNNNKTSRHKFDPNIFPLIDYSANISTDDTTTRLNPLLEMFQTNESTTQPSSLLDMLRTNEPAARPSPLDMLRSNESTTQLSPLLELTPFPAVGVDPTKKGPPLLNKNLSPHLPLVSLNKENLGARNSVPPAHDPISTPAIHIPIVAKDISTNDKPAQLNTTSKENQHEEALSNTSGSSTVLSCPPGNELSLAVVLCTLVTDLCK
jgi:hypothetical protein